MDDLKRIEELLEEYYAGETSTAEEEILHDFFTGADVPPHLQAESGLFSYFSARKADTLPGERVARIESAIDDAISDLSDPESGVSDHPGTEESEKDSGAPEVPIRQIGGGSRLRYYWISGAAAVALVLIALFIDMRLGSNEYEVRQDTYEDPYMAYLEARRVLYMVSSRMNEVTKPLNNIKKMDQGVDYMHPVFSFGAGIQHLEHLGTFERTKQIISN